MAKSGKLDLISKLHSKNVASTVKVNLNKPYRNRSLEKNYHLIVLHQTLISRVHANLAEMGLSIQ